MGDIMTKIIWMSDPHFQAKGTIDGLDPRKRLAAAIDHANAHHDDADFAVMSGDLVGDDVAGDYAAIAGYLARSAMPMYLIMGNNDERTAFRHQLTLPNDVMADFVQYTLNSEVGLFVFLDTHKLGSAVGELCDARMSWLDRVLTENAERDVYASPTARAGLAATGCAHVGKCGCVS